MSMPKRLLDLHNNRLDCSAGRGSVNYAALTHRWGAPAAHGNFRLYGDNLDYWQRFMDLDKLPKTFRDAVKVTKSLGLRYLWIDSLCIVQDDPKDLRTEVHTMENVFSFAYVTLSATSARDTVDGFIKSRTQRQSYSVDILSPSGGDASKVYLCEPIDDFRRDVEHSELSRRGWVFQERALSRRTIHFTETQVYWECGKGIRCETLTKLAKYVALPP